MLVVISDLHLTDGTSGDTIRDGAFRAFRERFRDLVYDASWRADGTYVPIQSVTLILLGDILDVIRSAQWQDGDVRPWTATDQAAFTAKIESVTDGILQHNEASLACFRSLSEPGVITIPEATNDKQPKRVGRDPKAPERQQVQVNLYYMVGNHDWFFHLPDPEYNAIRQKIVNAMGLSHPTPGPFPHVLEELQPIAKICNEHQLFVRHGDIYDPFNYEGDRNASSLGDAIVVELVNRFALVAGQKLKGIVPATCIDGLREIDNVRPLLAAPAWIEGVLRRTCPDPHQARQVKDVWDSLVDDFLRVPFVQRHHRPFHFDMVEKLELALKFSRGASMRTLEWLTDRWGTLEGGNESYVKFAMAEQAFKNRSAKYLVFGHTHHFEIVPLDSSIGTSGLFDQMYINSGTWRRIHERAIWNPAENEFMGYYVMTYLAFFKDGERGGRTFESWSGALGVAEGTVAT